MSIDNLKLTAIDADSQGGYNHSVEGVNGAALVLRTGSALPAAKYGVGDYITVTRATMGRYNSDIQIVAADVENDIEKLASPAIPKPTKTATPTSSYGASGAYQSIEGLKLTSDKGAEIWYTTDGTEPAKDSPNSKKYNPETGIAENITLSDTPVVIKAIAYSEGLESSDIAVFSYTLLVSKGYNHYYGQLHAHTNMSDGSGSVDEAFKYARSVEGLDFMALTEHSNSLDDGSAETNPPTPENGINAPYVQGSEFAKARQAATDITTKDFVGIVGYEMSWSGSTGKFGHMNTFNTLGYESRNNTYYTSNTAAAETNGLYRYYNRMKAATGTLDGNTPINMLNHPGTTFGDFSDFRFYDPSLDPYVQLIEVGNGDGAVGSTGYFPSYKAYDRALAKGWHIAPSNNQDNHKGKWGNANTTRTVVLAESLTEFGIYDAIRNRRVYATEDENLKVDYTFNGYNMGYIYPNDTKLDTNKIEVTLAHKQADRLFGGTVNVIGENGSVIKTVKIADNDAMGADYTQTGQSAAFKWNVDVPSNNAYYYIQVVEAKGPNASSKYLAVTAPVWIGKPTGAGLRNTVIEDVVPVAGLATRINSTFYNDEEGDLIISEIVYEAASNDKKPSAIHTFDGNITVKKGKTESYGFDYTPPLGTTVINVTATGTLNGTPVSFSDALTFSAADPNVSIYIGIDATKYGEYVSGNYANSYKNLLQVAGDNHIVIKLLKEITPQALKDLSLVIVPTPNRKSRDVTALNGAGNINVGPQVYSDAELKAYADYASAGGSFIVAGIADYSDGKGEYHAAKQLNKVLAAIGAGSAVDDAQAMDFDQNGGQSYRLYFDYDDHNPKSAYSSGVTETQKYSFYSGTSLTPDTDATWIIKGHDTTFAVDADGDSGPKVSATQKPSGDLTAADLARGIVKGQKDVITLLSEPLPGGGTVWLGGSAFFSDFELGGVDKQTDLEYSNKIVTSNILNELRDEIPLSTISKAREGENGQVFRVKGVVASHSKRHNPDNYFFDCVYIQAENGESGINVFGIQDYMDYKIGDIVEVTGTIGEYVEDLELKISSAASIVKMGDGKAPEPKTLTTTEARNLAVNGGLLAKITGKVTKLTESSGKVQEVWLKDSSDISEFGARLWIDGYIAGKDSSIQVGDTATGIGFVSASDDGLRLRVRDRAEIMSENNPNSNPAPTHKPEPKPEPKPNSDNNGASNSGSSNSGGSSSGGSYTGSNTTSSTPSSAIAISQSHAVSIVTSAIAAGKNATLVNPGKISLGVMQAMKNVAKAQGVTVNADTLGALGAIDVRVSFNPSAATQDINLSASTTSGPAVSAKAIFAKYFSNKVSTVNLAHQGSFGMTVRVAAKLDTKLQKSNSLYFYSYYAKTNVYKPLVNTQYRIDRNGYVHFNTGIGGTIIISNGKLMK